MLQVWSMLRAFLILICAAVINSFGRPLYVESSASGGAHSLIDDAGRS